jgi:hypothetical protein
MDHAIDALIEIFTWVGFGLPRPRDRRRDRVGGRRHLAAGGGHHRP